MKVAFALVLSVLLNSCFAQKPRIEGVNPGKISWENFENEYLVIGDTTQQKPLLFYCTGSLSVPLFLTQDGQEYCTLPFTYSDYTERFHIVVVSKPGVPLFVETSQVNQRTEYLDPKTGQISADFTRHNRLDYAAALQAELLSRLVQRSWVDREQVLVVGHSAGARLAAKVGTAGPASHLAYLSCEPQGRFYEILRLETSRAANPAETALAQLETWKQVVAQQKENQQPAGDSYASTFTNSENVVDDLLATDRPVFAAYGTADRKAEGMLILPYAFIRAGKENLTFVPYLGGEHSFFEVGADGRPDYEDYHFDEVMADIIAWWLDGQTEFNYDLSQR